MNLSVGRGWHSLRRKFASDLMDQPLKVLCELGGWKEAKTVLHCYQRADEAQLRKALESRHRGSRLRPIGGSQTAGIRSSEARKFNYPNQIRICLLLLPRPCSVPHAPGRPR